MEEGVVDAWMLLFIDGGEDVVDVVFCCEFYLLLTSETCFWLLLLEFFVVDIGISARNSGLCQTRFFQN